MTEAKDSVVISSGSKITIGLAVLLIGTVSASIPFVSSLTASVDGLIKSNTEMRKSVDRNTDAAVKNDRALAILQTIMEAQGERLRALEQETRRK